MIWSINDAGGSGQGYGIDNLSFSASITNLPLVTIPTLSAATFINSGIGAGLNFSFTNTSGASAYFTIWSTTNLALPLNQWQNLGHPLETSGGNYQFNDPQATNLPQQFYRVTSP